MKCEKISDEKREAWDERAAIIEEGCKVSRAESEKMAAEQMELTDDAAHHRCDIIDRCVDDLRELCAARRTLSA